MGVKLRRSYIFTFPFQTKINCSVNRVGLRVTNFEFNCGLRLDKDQFLVCFHTLEKIEILTF